MPMSFLFVCLFFALPLQCEIAETRNCDYHSLFWSDVTLLDSMKAGDSYYSLLTQPVTQLSG